MRKQDADPPAAPRNTSMRFDCSCRPHGGCPWCRRTRLYQDTKARQRAAEQLKEMQRGEP